MAQTVDPPQPDTVKDGKSKAQPAEEEPEELSEEDQLLKDSLEARVAQLKDSSASTVQEAIDAMTKEIKEATTSMTSVPKPLKFLRPHYSTIKSAYSAVPKSCQGALADVISVLATVSAGEGEREALSFCLKGTGGDPSTWGHEYIGHLAGEIAEEQERRLAQEPAESVDDLMQLVKAIVMYHMKHNSEPEAVDLLLEVDSIGVLLDHIDSDNYQRTCLYLTSTAAYLSEPDDHEVFTAAFDAYMKVEKWHDAMRVALALNSRPHIERVFTTCTDTTDKEQLAYLLARQGVLLDVEAGPCAMEDETARETVTEILSNSKLSERYLALARDLDVMEAKLPEDIYKMHLVDTHRAGLPNPTMESGMKNLSDSLVNALLNLGFSSDKLVTAERKAGEKPWVARNKNHGKTCAVASIGAIHMWNFDAGLPPINDHLESTDADVLAGACLGVGLTCTGVHTEMDPAFALLEDHVGSDKPAVQNCSVMALGLAYAGTAKPSVKEALSPLIDSEEPLERAAHASLALGLIYAGTSDEDIAQAVLHYLMLAPEAKLTEPFIKFVILGLGFLFLGKQEAVEPTVEVVRSLNERVSQFAAVTLEACAYAGTGNVLKVQSMLAMCGEHIDVEEGQEWKKAHLGAAALGVGLVASGEDLGGGMATRMLEHLLSYGDSAVRAAVPLTLALLRPSQPDMAVMDTLSRLTHDSDVDVARAALLGLGIIGAGTNNARLAGMLRNLSSYYFKDAPGLHLVRVAQGLLHAGKGLVTLSPHHADRTLLSPVSLASLLTVLMCGFETSATLCGPHAYMLFYLAPALRPRVLMTLDEAGDLLPVSVRVGQAVDTVAQAGKPKAITGFQTHDTPVLLAAEDRAELATDKYLPVTPLLEGFVILKKNPAYVEGDD